MCYSVMVENDLKLLEQEFSASIDSEAFEHYYSTVESDSKIKDLRKHPRIYPNYWAPVIRIDAQGRRKIVPMRYRVRPKGSSKEIPSKYNVFNARMDSLENRQTWKNLFMKQHGLLIMKSFFEWVEDISSRKKKVVSFKPESHEHILVPVLWDEWTDGLGLTRFESFAVITTDPTPEVLEKGHDRCPIFIKKQRVEDWLKPVEHSKARILQALSDREDEFYTCEDATA